LGLKYNGGPVYCEQGIMSIIGSREENNKSNYSISEWEVLVGKKMVFWPALSEDAMAQIADFDLDVVTVSSEAGAIEAIGDADAFYGRLTPDILSGGKQLKWVQATSAGLDGYFFPELRESDVVLTNLRGIYSDVIADHVFAFILTLARGMQVYALNQAEGRWGKGAGVIHLGGKVLGIIGLGGIGLEVAKRGNAFGMTVMAVDPAPKDRPDYVTDVFDPKDLGKMLAQADFVVICVPHTGETEYMIDRNAMDHMKDSAVLVNIGRGKVVDLTALTEAIQAGTMGGAGLDVFETEPLPEGHPLWALDQVVITPHVAGISPEVPERRKRVIVENVRRFVVGERLLNEVDKQRGYVVAANEGARLPGVN
jgi:phosphoglycerate dehydrogenase-like enzyme